VVTYKGTYYQKAQPHLIRINMGRTHFGFGTIPAWAYFGNGKGSPN